jgi:hypothetical protein
LKCPFTPGTVVMATTGLFDAAFASANRTKKGTAFESFMFLVLLLSLF